MKQILERLGLFVRRWRTYSRIRAELASYSERELRDMGISSADIDRIAREAAALTRLSGRYGDRLGARASSHPYA